MFDQTFVNTNARTRRPWTVALSLTLQTCLVTIAFLAPLLHVAVLQKPDAVPVWLPPQLLKHQIEPEPKPAARTVVSSRPVFPIDRLPMPVAVPRKIDMTPDAPDLANLAGNEPAGGPAVFGILPGITVEPPKPEPAPVPRQQSSRLAPVHVSGGVQSAKLVFGPRPVYPPLARVARVQGTVRIQAIIGRDGAIRNLQVLSGPPLLIDVARQAVQQWRYQPTLLNSEPVEVITEIDVNFTIDSSRAEFPGVR